MIQRTEKGVKADDGVGQVFNLVFNLPRDQRQVENLPHSLCGNDPSAPRGYTDRGRFFMRSVQCVFLQLMSGHRR
jgi:hypothetical protein